LPGFCVMLQVATISKKDMLEAGKQLILSCLMCVAFGSNGWRHGCPSVKVATPSLRSLGLGPRRQANRPTFQTWAEHWGGDWASCSVSFFAK
jgi:hypothetical protein